MPTKVAKERRWKRKVTAMAAAQQAVREVFKPKTSEQLYQEIMKVPPKHLFLLALENMSACYGVSPLMLFETETEAFTERQRRMANPDIDEALKLLDGRYVVIPVPLITKETHG